MLSRDKPEQDKLVMIKAASLIIAEFDLFNLIVVSWSQCYSSSVLYL